MPKLKTHSGSKKRFAVTKNGKLVRRHATGNHFLQKKTASRKRVYSGTESMSGKIAKSIKLKLGA